MSTVTIHLDTSSVGLPPCPYCHGTGVYASPLTNWDGVDCDKCQGTGLALADAIIAEPAA
jgi:DnaJ-class molecular chaperone